MDETVKDLEKIPNTIQGNDALKKIVDQRPLTKDSHRQRAVALNVLAKRKELEDKHKDMINQSQQHGLDVNAILKARPDFASHLTKTDRVTNQQVPMNVREAVNKQKPGEIWQNIQKEALDNKTVSGAIVMNERAFLQFGRHADKETKQKLISNLQKLRREGHASIKVVAQQRLNEIANNPDWR